MRDPKRAAVPATLAFQTSPGGEAHRISGPSIAAEAGTVESAADRQTLEEAFVPETEEALRRRRSKLEKPASEARAAWLRKASLGDFDSVRAPMDVYAFAGEGVKTDPRRCDAYRDQVAQGVGLHVPE